MATCGGHAYPQRMATFSLTEELAAWSRLAREVEVLLASGSGGGGGGETSDVTRVNPAVSAWSPLQHMAHVTLANELVLRNLGNLVRGSGMLVVFEAEQNPRALDVLVAGRLPRGAAQSPRMVVPPRDVDVVTAHDWAAKLSADLDGFRAGVDAERLPRCFVPHQTLGMLDAGQWARFGGAHTAHHLEIAREVLGVG